jgi:hypothetical protein
MDGSQPRRADRPGETSTRRCTAPACLRVTPDTPDQGRLSRDTAPCAISVARRPVWRDVEQIAAQLTHVERATLMTLIRVPLAPVTLLEQLGGLHGGAALYRRLARLRAAGLVAELRPLIQPRYSPAYRRSLRAIACLARSRWPDLAGHACSTGSSRAVAAFNAPQRRCRPGWSCRRTPRLHGTTGAQTTCSSPISVRPTCASTGRCCISSMRFDGPSAMPHGSSSPPTAGGQEPGRRFSRTSPGTGGMGRSGSGSPGGRRSTPTCRSCSTSRSSGLPHPSTLRSCPSRLNWWSSALTRQSHGRSGT